MSSKQEVGDHICRVPIWSSGSRIPLRHRDTCALKGTLVRYCTMRQPRYQGRVSLGSSEAGLEGVGVRDEGRGTIRHITSNGAGKCHLDGFWFPFPLALSPSADLTAATTQDHRLDISFVQTGR